MGSKSRVAKDIVPIIQSYINDNNITAYYEPFCGGCNIIDKICCENKYASDLNPYLIGLFNYLKSDGDLLPEVSRELYSEVRKGYKSGDYEDWYVGNVGFLASYNGRFFDGGYAKPGYEKTKNGLRYRDYYRESSDNILAQRQNIKDINFSCVDYRALNPRNAVVYCDPPYANQKQYANATQFDYDVFWDTMREWSEDNLVLISELEAPDDFKCIWENTVSRSIKAGDKSTSVEKLFVYERGVSNGRTEHKYLSEACEDS